MNSNNVPPRLRPAWMYRAAFLLVPTGLAYLLISGRLPRYFALFRAEQVSDTAEPFVTGLMWIVCVSPLIWLAWDVGAQHTRARRLDYAIIRGIADAWRAAWSNREQAAELAEPYARPPADSLVTAVVWGLGAAVLPVVFFLGLAPELRTEAGITWVAGAGMLFGLMAYGRRRASAYIIEEPDRWDMLRQWRLLNVDRYRDDGRRFVRLQIVCTILMPMWWLGFGSLVVFR